MCFPCSTRLSLSLCLLFPFAVVAADNDKPKIAFKRTQLDATFRSEGVAVGDFNRDGKLDIAAGSVYYAAPDWKMVVIDEKAKEFDPKGYSDSFCNFADDLNGDGWTDLIVVGFPGQATRWYENPQKTGGPWKMHIATPITNNESPQYLDVDGDGKRELLCAIAPAGENPDGPNRQMALIRPGADPTEPWKIQTISAKSAPGTNKYAHGLGAGDVNGDGQRDVVVPQGWWEAPPRTEQDAREWTFHPAPFGQACAQMYVYDFDGDGDNDVVSSSAHNYGIWWHEQLADGWKTHLIEKSFSQTHGLCLADINGDGLPDLVTGKRWWAHGGRDPGGNEPAVFYWFELTRRDGKAHWTPHQFDHDSGPGTQFEVADVNGDGLLDVVTSNKKGVHYFEQTRK